MTPVSFIFAVSALFLSSAGISAMPVEPREWKAHDQIATLKEEDYKAPGVAYELYLKHKPYLKVVSGCVPFPAVDKDGNLNSGLKPSGAMNGQCSESTGQVYVRAASKNGRFAIMYSWYMPKDMNVNGPGNLGHRHDWENIVVWLSGETSDAKVTGVSYSGHGKYTTDSNPPFADGSHPLVACDTVGGLDHSLTSTNAKGGQQPLINWTQLPAKAKEALLTAEFGKAVVPFRDDNHQANLNKAWSDMF